MEIKQAIFPLPIEDLKAYIMGKTGIRKEISLAPKFIIDYDKSSLKGKHFLSYGANLELSYTLTNFTKEQLLELLEVFVEGDQFITCTTLAEQTAAMLLNENAGILSDKDQDYFKLKHHDTLKIWTDFLGSMLYCIPMTFKWYHESVGVNLQNLAERSEAPINAASLVLIPSFLENYLAVNPPEKYWFKFIEDPLYYGNCFLNFFYYTTSFLPLLYSLEQLGKKEEVCLPSI